MTMINTVYFGLDDLPVFDGAVAMYRINTSDPLTSDYSFVSYSSDEYRSVVDSLEYKLREALRKRTYITVPKISSTDEDWFAGHTLTNNSKPVPDSWISTFSHKVGVSNAPFKQRVLRKDIVFSPYERCEIYVESYPRVIPGDDWNTWVRTTFPPDLTGFPGYRGTRFFIDGVHFLAGTNPESVLSLRGWRGNVSQKVIPPISISAHAIHDKITSSFEVDSGTVTATLGQANKGTVDALTALAEMPELVRSCIDGFKLIGKMIRDVNRKEFAISEAFKRRKDNEAAKHREDLFLLEQWRAGIRQTDPRANVRKIDTVYRKKRRRLEKSYKKAVKNTEVEFVDALTDVWMNFRYNIYPSVKTAEETIKALENLQVQFLRFAKFNYSTVNLSDLGVDADIDIRESCTIRRSVDSSVGLFGGNSGMFSANIAVTLHELIKKSWVVDWFINVGDFLSAFTIPTTYSQQGCSYAFKSNISINYTNSAGSNVRIRGYVYKRLIINPFTYACLTLQWDMNWMRYTDATALIWQAIRTDIKTAIRTGK